MMLRWLGSGLAVGVLGLVVTVSGCMMGPDYSRPQTAAETATAFVNGVEQSTPAAEGEDTDRWWERFGDPVTAGLVREALRNNYDLKAGAARLLQARATLDQAAGQLLPDISYEISRTRSKTYMNLGDLGDLFPGAPSGGFSPLITTWSQGISVSYLVDFWGKLRRAHQAALEDMLAAEANQQAMVNSIVATVIQARINIAMIQRRLVIARANTASLEETLRITERRARAGLVSPVETKLARGSLESARLQEPVLEQVLATARHSLDVLVGRQPGTAVDLPQTLPELPNLAPAPVGVPASLLDRRPDLRAAEFSLRAANDRVGVSMAQLYPDLLLTGTYGSTSDRWEDLWDRNFEVYSAITALSAPIWKGGQLRAQVRAAEARYAELTANYAGIVLQAMQEVEDALVGERLLQRQLEHAQLQLAEYEQAEELSRRRYDAGVESLLTVLESERRRRIAQEQLTLLKGQVWTTRVNLHLALGGNWGDSEGMQEQIAKR